MLALPNLVVRESPTGDVHEVMQREHCFGRRGEQGGKMEAAKAESAFTSRAQAEGLISSKNMTRLQKGLVHGFQTMYTMFAALDRSTVQKNIGAQPRHETWMLFIQQSSGGGFTGEWRLLKSWYIRCIPELPEMRHAPVREFNSMVFWISSSF